MEFERSCELPPRPGRKIAAEFTEEQKTQIARGRKKLLVSVAIGLLAPIALYYVLRAFGVSPVTSLLLGCVPALLEVLYKFKKEGKPDAIGLFTLTLLLVGGGFSLITGSPQWIFAKAGVFTGVIGAWVLFTTFRRPAIFVGVMNMQPNATEVAKWEANWNTYPEIRYALRAVNVIWGAGLVLDSVVRFVLAYTLPVDSVPSVTLIQFLVAIALIQVVSKRYARWYLAKHGLRLQRNDVVRLHG